MKKPRIWLWTADQGRKDLMDSIAKPEPNTRDKLPALGDFLDRLENVRRVGDAYKAQCPLHDSKSGQNLSVTEKNGQVLTYCHSQQCKFEDIVAALYKKTYTHARVYKGRVFEYTDLAGDVVAVHKHKGSWFLPYRDIWIAKEPANRPIYNLPEVAEGVKTKQTVYIVEGEKDAETARGLGLVATTSGGANTWGRVTPYVGYFAGADVVVLPDNDRAGDGYANDVAASLVGTARGVKVLKLKDLMPSLPEGGDLTDYIEAGGTKDEVTEALDRVNPVNSVNPINPVNSVNPKSVADLMSRELPDITWVVEDVLPEGVSILAGKPKKGKSWLALGLCLTAPTGGFTLGGKKVAKGKSLYLALEDNERRMQRRIRKILQGRSAPKDMFYVTQWPRLEEGGAQQLERWLRDNPDTKLVVIDTLAKVRKPARGQAVYQEDYSALESLLPIAAEHQIAILVVHHLRQLPGADPQDEISGSSGLTGGVDGWMILRRAPGSNGPTLHVDGRDIEEAKEYALEWCPDRAVWSIAGVAEEVHLHETRRQILGVLDKAGSPMPPKEVSELLPGLKYNNVKVVMHKMLEDDQLTKDDKGRYSPLRVNGVNEPPDSVNLTIPDTYAKNVDSVNGVNEVNGHNATPINPDAIPGAKIIEGEL